MDGFTVTDRRGLPAEDRWRWMPGTRAAWSPSDTSLGTAKPAAPVLTEQERPTAGRLLGPSGQVAVVVHYRPAVPFGFQA